MYNLDPDQYVEGQRRDWDRVAAGWDEWDKWLDANMAVLNTMLVERAAIASGHNTLDLGSGTGYPALEAAKKVGESGSVTGLDLSEKMLKVARRKAGEQGFDNVTFKTCDIRNLPFKDAFFDSVISRFCLMFVPAPEKALNEILRVLKKGSGFSALVWAGPERNPSLTIPMGILKEYIDIPAPDPSAPGLFSLGAPGNLAGMMEKAGFAGVEESEVNVRWEYASGCEYVEGIKALAAPMRNMFDKVPLEKRDEVESKIAEKVEQFRNGDKVLFDGIALAVAGRCGDA